MGNDKLVAVLSYITILGWIIALILHMNDKTKLGGFHVRQSLMLMICGIIASWIPMIGMILMILLFIFWIMGLVSAIQGKTTPLPLIGDLAQDWFRGL